MYGIYNTAYTGNTFLHVFTGNVVFLSCSMAAVNLMCNCISAFKKFPDKFFACVFIICRKCCFHYITKVKAEKIELILHTFYRKEYITGESLI